MTNKEVINWLTRIRDRLMTTSSKQFESMTIAIAALEQQEKAFDEWCTDCKEYDKDRHCCPRYNRVIRGAVDEVKQQRWIPITERMPEENDFVLVTVSGEDVRGCEWKDSMALAVWTNQWNLVDANLVSYRISAWRPLPEPYKE